MRVLSLDLDFFLDHIATFPVGSRLSDADFKAWSGSDFRRFLENRCGLSKDNPLPGRMIENHDELFSAVDTLLSSGLASAPLELVHVDAHSDLGDHWDGSPKFVMTVLTHLPVEQRLSQIHDQMGCANFLVFMVACRWLNRITFIRHKLWASDFSLGYWQDFNPNSGHIQLKSYNSMDDYMRRRDIISVEPPVEFQILTCDQFEDKENGYFDFAFISRSPQYTPPASDILFDIGKEYIRPFFTANSLLMATQ